MSLFANLDNDAAIATEKDSVGGGFMVDSALYDMTIVMAFAEESSGGALGVTFHLKDDASGAMVRVTEYVTSGRSKGQLNTYLDKDGKKQFLPGYNKVNAACLLTVGKELKVMTHVEKSINRYDFDLGKEVPTKTQVLTELLDQKIKVGMIKQKVDKNTLVDGQWISNGATREENVADKYFRSRDNLTTQEILGGITEALFVDVWDKKHTGTLPDKSTPTAAGGATAGAPLGAANAAGTPAPAPAAEATTSLFA